MENFDADLPTGESNSMPLSYAITVRIGGTKKVVTTFGEAVTVLTRDISQTKSSIERERAHEAIGAALDTGETMDIKTATHLFEQVCRHEKILA
jgi:hypothetical protein